MRIAKSLFDYRATSLDELSVSRAERLEVIDSTRPGRWLVRNRLGEKGYVPASQLEMISSPARRTRGSVWGWGVGMGVWGWVCGGGCVGMGVWGWVCGGGCVGVGVWGWVCGDGGVSVCVCGMCICICVCNMFYPYLSIIVFCLTHTS